ncbi:hypothetical protein GQ607_001856 [Colletotrichum asianum]|uniref:Uncharacterized protein n=1 Tax=Colletotrichum asianum TaxID=702518 RepID=A0A8H3WS04_9PEZI|nr:hypothetical protein GQ607_001856 [Colletotrichum asianum]
MAAMRVKDEQSSVRTVKQTSSDQRPTSLISLPSRRGEAIGTFVRRPSRQLMFFLCHASRICDQYLTKSPPRHHGERRYAAPDKFCGLVCLQTPPARDGEKSLSLHKLQATLVCSSHSCICTHMEGRGGPGGEVIGTVSAAFCTDKAGPLEQTNIVRECRRLLLLCYSDCISCRPSFLMYLRKLLGVVVVFSFTGSSRTGLRLGIDNSKRWCAHVSPLSRFTYGLHQLARGTASTGTLVSIPCYTNHVL